MKFSELNDNDKKVIVGIHKAIIARGDDWVYPNDVDYDEKTDQHTFDEDWTNEDGGCYNLLNDGSAACIIGFIAIDQGLHTTRESTAQNDGTRWRVTFLVKEAMAEAQKAQDRNRPWGHALDRFNEVVRVGVQDYDKFLPILLSSHGISLIAGRPVGTPNS